MRGTARKLIVILTIIASFLAVPQGALAATQTQTRLMYGFVYSAANGRPLAGVTVTASTCNYAQSAVTASDGSWQITYPTDKVGTLTFSGNGFETQSFQIELNANWSYAGGVVSLQS